VLLSSKASVAAGSV